jgi:death-on-curing protein
VIRDGDWIYLEVADLLSLCERFTLGPVRDRNLLESACGRPRAGFGGVEQYTDAPAKAAALGWSLTRNHALVDGNKRLGAVATVAFLHINGYDVAVTPGELVALFLQIARGLMEQEELCLFLRGRTMLAPRAAQDAVPGPRQVPPDEKFGPAQ